jgi:hypothetical protein
VLSTAMMLVALVFALLMLAGSFLVNGTKGLLGKIFMETRYHIREFGSHRRDPVYGDQSRGP